MLYTALVYIVGKSRVTDMKILRIALISLAGLIWACGRQDVRAGYVPPPPRVAYVPAPGPGSWTKGYYVRRGPTWVWTPGTWVRAHCQSGVGDRDIRLAATA